MDYDFDREDFVEETKEQKEERMFNETYKKTTKVSKITLAITFGAMAVFFVLLDLIMYFTLGTENPDDVEGMIAMSVFAGVMLLASFLCIVIPFKAPNYQKFKKRNEKWGVYNSFDLIARIEMLEKRVEELENKNR